jgi:hypothetical protein
MDDAELIAEARRRYATSPNCEVDSDADTSRADDGAWVSAWVWVPYKEEPDGDH